MIFERLKELRNYEGYTQKDVASILNVQRATYAGWESGKDIMPLSQLLKIANNYQKSLDYITGLSNNDEKYISGKGNIDIQVVANNIHKYRKSNNITQKKMAQDLKTTQSNIHKYETGKCLITTMYALEFAKHYNYPLDDLIGRTVKKKPKN